MLCLVVVGMFGCTAARRADEQPRAARYTLRCHYLQGQKYALDQDAAAFQDWLMQLQFANMKNQEGPYDLFSHGGGGPLGAEWNADGELLIIFTYPGSQREIHDAQLTLNGHVCTPEPSQPNGEDWRWLIYRVPGEDWTAWLRPITADDHGLLYTPGDISAHGTGPGSPVGAGQILIAEFHSRAQHRVHITKAFHVAYGE
jgi:hypothetical protein